MFCCCSSGGLLTRDCRNGRNRQTSASWGPFLSMSGGSWSLGIVLYAANKERAALASLETAKSIASIQPFNSLLNISASKRESKRLSTYLGTNSIYHVREDQPSACAVL